MMKPQIAPKHSAQRQAKPPCESGLKLRLDKCVIRTLTGDELGAVGGAGGGNSGRDCTMLTR